MSTMPCSKDDRLVPPRDTSSIDAPSIDTSSIDASSIDASSIEAWLLTDGRLLELTAIVDGLAYRLLALGLPLDRMTVSFGLLNPSVLAAGIVWRPSYPLRYTRYNYSDRDDGSYERSPFKIAHEEKRWVELDVQSTPDEAFGIIPELKAEGLVSYIVIPMPDSSGRQQSMTVATRSPTGFDEDHRALIRSIIPSLRTIVEIKTMRGILRDVLSAYVGRTPAESIIMGDVHRGEVTEARAAILVADLRGFTHLSTRLPPVATAELINRFYDVMVPAIEDHGGEVLKFIGDAVLAIFPVSTMGDDGAALAALDAARAARAVVIPPFKLAGERVTITFGIAIHLGDAAYGNVGSRDRLDFTVIGRDVNIAARIASLCSRLGRDFLVSEVVADLGRRNGQQMAPAGAHEVRGLATPLAVFVPDCEFLPDEADDGISLGPALITTEV